MRGKIALIISFLCMSLAGIFTTLIGNSMSVYTIAFVRSLIALFIISIFVIFVDKTVFRVTKKDLLIYASGGFTLGASMIMFLSAFLLAPVANVELLNFTYPFFVFILAYLFLKERIWKKEIICLIVAFAGVAIINPFDVRFSFGNSLALVEAVFYGLTYIIMRYADVKHKIGTAFWFLFFATILLIPTALLAGFEGTWENMDLLIMFGFFTALAYLLLTFGLKRVKAHVAALMGIIIEPTSAIVLAFLILNQSVSLNVVIGGILIILAGIAVNKKHKHKSHKRGGKE